MIQDFIFRHLFSKLEHWRPFEALARNCKNTTPIWKNIKYSFVWLTGKWKQIFYVNNFFGFKHFLFHEIWKKIKKWTESKIVFTSKNQLCHVHQPCKVIFEICFVFTHFFVRASNGCQYSNFENWCLKIKSWGLYHAYILWKSWLPDDFPKPNLY